MIDGAEGGVFVHNYVRGLLRGTIRESASARRFYSLVLGEMKSAESLQSLLWLGCRRLTLLLVASIDGPKEGALSRHGLNIDDTFESRPLESGVRLLVL